MTKQKRIQTQEKLIEDGLLKTKNGYALVIHSNVKDKLKIESEYDFNKQIWYIYINDK